MSELPIRKRVYFGMAGITMNLPDLIIMQWLIVRYVPPDGPHLIPAVLFGVVILLGRMMEGVSNPIIAHWSDVSQARGGRRLPFMRLGIIPFAVVFFLLFVPPVEDSTWINVGYALILTQAYFFLYSAIITPYLALLPEITSNLKERVDLTTAQAVFIMIGNFIFAGMGVVLDRWGWTAAAAGASALIILFFIPVSTAVEEKYQQPPPNEARLSLWQSIRLTWDNRPFRFVLVCTSLYWFGLNGIIAWVPFWVESYLGRPKSAVTLLMVGFLVMSLVFFFVFNALSRRFSKYVLMSATFLGTGLVLAAFPLVGYLHIGSEFAQTAFLMAMAGAPVAGFVVLPFAILADVVDYDEKRIGRRREAIFFGMQGIAQKALIGLSVLTFTMVPFLGNNGQRPLRPGGSLIFTGEYRLSNDFQHLDPEPEGEWKLVASGSWSREEGLIVDNIAEELKPFPPPPDAIYVDVKPDFLDAPWTLTGPAGYVRQGRGKETVTNMPPGTYTLVWGETPGWDRPESVRQATPLGLKLMALLCGMASVAAFVLFLRYPLRERDGKIVYVGGADQQ